MKYDVITLGSATQDVFIRSKSMEEQKDPLAPDGIDVCVPLGSKLGIDELTFSTGGGATNAATTFSRLGLKTACIARIGKDVIGQAIKTELKKEKIDTRFIQIDPKEKTGYSVILLDRTGHRGILTHRGAAQNLQAKELPLKKTRYQWIYLTSFGGDIKLAKEVIASGKRIGAKISWNPGGRELEKGLRALRPLIKQVDVLHINREEAAQLTDLPPRHLQDVIKKLAEFFDGILVVTDGPHGAYAHTEGKTFFAGTLKEKPTNTTGAGDAFGSGFVAALAKGKDLQTALCVAALNADGVVKSMGAKAGILKSFPKKDTLEKIKVVQLRGETKIR